MAVLALLMVWPLAHAALRITQIDVVTDPLPPDVGQTPLHVLGDVDCASLLVRRDPGSTSGVQLDITSGGDNLLLSGPLQTLVDLAPCGAQTTVRLNVTLTATVLGSAPAMQPQPGWVRWQLPDHPSEPVDAGFSQANFTVRALPLVVPQVVWETPSAQMGDQPVVFRGAARNLGNVGVRIAAAAAGTATFNGAPAGQSVVTVSVGPTDGDATELQVEVGVPTEPWTVLLVHGNLTFTSALDPVGEPRNVPFQFLLTSTTHGQNKVGEVPLPLGVPLAALVVAALVTRRSGRP